MIKKNAIMESPREHLSPFSEEAIALWASMWANIVLHCEALSSRNLIHTRTRVDLNMMMLKRLADSGQSIYFKTWKVLDWTDEESLIPWKNCFSEAEVASNDFWQIVTSPTSTIFFRAHFSLQGVLACNCPTASTNGLVQHQSGAWYALQHKVHMEREVWASYHCPIASTNC